MISERNAKMFCKEDISISITAISHGRLNNVHFIFESR